MKLFGRNFSVKIGPNDSELIELAGLRCVFDVEKSAESNPNNMVARIYNLNDETIQFIEASGDILYLSASYADKPVAVFAAGDVVRCSTEKTGVDVVTTIAAGDGVIAYTEATIVGFTSKGSSPVALITALADALKAEHYNRIKGRIHGKTVVLDGASLALINSYLNYATAQYPAMYSPTDIFPGFTRRFTTWGRAADTFDDVANRHAIQWFIDNYALKIVPTFADSGKAPVSVSQYTGLVGMPTKLENGGIRFRHLINPNIEVFGAVELMEDIPYNLAGKYRVDTIKIVGDTHGNDWYYDVVCSNPYGAVEIPLFNTLGDMG